MSKEKICFRRRPRNPRRVRDVGNIMAEHVLDTHFQRGGSRAALAGAAHLQRGRHRTPGTRCRPRPAAAGRTRVSRSCLIWRTISSSSSSLSCSASPLASTTGMHDMSMMPARIDGWREPVERLFLCHRDEIPARNTPDALDLEERAPAASSSRCPLPDSHCSVSITKRRG